jgi:hypothetical protein
VGGPVPCQRSADADQPGDNTPGLPDQIHQLEVLGYRVASISLRDHRREVESGLHDRPTGTRPKRR